MEIVVAAAAAVLILGLLCECIRELHRFRVKHYSVYSAKLSDLAEEKKIVLLSDLHNHVYGTHNDELLRSIHEIAPDVILIAGDMLVAKANVSFEPAADFISKLPKLCPVYYANGNHEERMKKDPLRYGTGFSEYKKRLMRSGVVFLENESRIKMLDEAALEIYGLELPGCYYEKFKKKEVPQSVITGCIGKANPELYQILIAHNPIYFDAYRKWGADLVVSGHLHGGIARIPGFRGVITPQAFLFPKYSGEMTTKGKSSIIVSRGLGTHTVNVRLFNTPEVVVIHLQKQRDTGTSPKSKMSKKVRKI